MTHRWPPLVLLGWALLTPPYGGTIQDTWLCTGCGDPGHLNDGAPLSRWRRLGTYPDADTCDKARDVFIAQASGDDEKWSDMQMSRCFPEERVGKGRLRPGE
jgi:hypothetical protein